MRLLAPKDARSPRAFLVLALLVPLTACGETEPEPPLLTGTWFGVSEVLGVDIDWTAHLAESETGFVSGIFHLDQWPLSLDIDATGTHAYPLVNLTLSYSVAGFPVTGRYEGTLLSDDLLRGTLTVVDYLSVTFDLERAGGR